MTKEIFATFKNHIHKINPITLEIWDEIEPILMSRELKKNDFIVKENQKCNNEIFVYTGVVRGFYTFGQEEEMNVSFYHDNEIVCPYFSRTIDGRSNINIQAITPAIIVEIDQDVFKKIRHKYLEMVIYSGLVVENELRIRAKHEIFLLKKSAEERYHMFREMYPSFENKIPQFHVASYLRITPVSYSRLRKKLIRK